MSRVDSKQELRVEDYEGTYELIGIMGASIIVLMVIISVVLKQFGTALPSGIWHLPGFVMVFISARVKVETLIRFGLKRIIFFYLVFGQVLCLFPGLLMSSITPAATPNDPIILWTGFGLILAMIAIGGSVYQMRKNDNKLSVDQPIGIEHEQDS